MKLFSPHIALRRSRKFAIALLLVAICSLLYSACSGELSFHQFVQNILLFGSGFLVAHYVFEDLKSPYLAVIAFLAICLTPPLRQSANSCDGGALKALLLTALCLLFMRALQSFCLKRMCAAGVIFGLLIGTREGYTLLPILPFWLCWLRCRGYLSRRAAILHGTVFSLSGLMTLYFLPSANWQNTLKWIVLSAQESQIFALLLLGALLSSFTLSLLLDKSLTATVLLPAILQASSGQGADLGLLRLEVIPVTWLAVFVGLDCAVRSATFITDGTFVTLNLQRSLRLIPGYLTSLRIFRKFLRLLENHLAWNWLAEMHYNCRIEYEDARIAQWKKRNPGSTYADFYAYKQQIRLQRGDSHPTLGARLEGPKPIKEMGTTAFRLFRKQGLEAHHKLADFGCGSLRLGQHIIPFLGEGQYFGLDLVDFFFEIGQRELIDQKLLAEKRPLLRVINEESLLQARNFAPDFIISFAVLVHVPPTELNRYFANLVFLAHEKTILLVHGDLAERNCRYSLESWAHSQSRVETLIKRLGGTLRYLKIKPAYFRTRPKNLQDLAKKKSVKTVWMKITFDSN